jgi:hypothetical protein
MWRPLPPSPHFERSLHPGGSMPFRSEHSHCPDARLAGILPNTIGRDPDSLNLHPIGEGDWEAGGCAFGGPYASHGMHSEVVLGVLGGDGAWQ